MPCFKFIGDQVMTTFLLGVFQPGEERELNEEKSEIARASGLFIEITRKEKKERKK